MRNLCGVATRLSSVIKNLSIQVAANRGSCRYSSQHADSSSLKRERQLRDVEETVEKAIRAIRVYKVNRNRKGKMLYVMDEETAKKFAAMRMADRRSNPSYVAEINSGLGFLTKALLDAGIPSINMFESIPDLIPNLIALAAKYPGRAVLRPANFEKIWSIGYVGWKANNDTLQSYFNDVKKRAWEKNPAIGIIGVLGDLSFIRFLILMVIFQNMIAKYGRMVLHVAIPPSVWAHLTCTNKCYDLYRSHVILFQTLFNYELLDTLPRSGFYPYHRQAKNKKYQRVHRAEVTENDGRHMNVVKIEAKPDLFKDDFPVADIVPFYYFVHCHLKSRATRIIPALEKWIPGCGRILITHGYDIYTEFGELTPQEIMNLFKLFRSWPEYKESSFVSCMDSFLTRRDEHIIYDTNSDNLDEMFRLSMDEAQSSLESKPANSLPENSNTFINTRN